MPSSLKLYSIEVTADIAQKMRVLAETGVFRMRNGSCEVHFDTEGNISQVITHTYQKVIHTKVLDEVDMKGAIL